MVLLIVILIVSTCATTPPHNDLTFPGKKQTNTAEMISKDFFLTLLRMNLHGNKMTMVIWIPQELYRGFLIRHPHVKPGQIKRLTETTRHYTIVFAAAGTLKGPDIQGMDYYTGAEIMKNLRIKDSLGHLHKPLTESEISPDMKQISSLLRTSLKELEAQKGMKIYAFFFQKNGKAIVNAADEGGFSAVLYGQDHRWDLPFPIPQNLVLHSK